MLCTHKTTILCQFGLIICHQLTNSYLHQFSTIFGGNCIKDAKYARRLRTFGEMAVVAIHEGKKMRSKLDNRGKTCMFVGYADDHTKDVYRFLNIHTKRIILSRDVRWLNIMWKRYKKKSIYARSRVELFLDEEESLL